MTSREQPNPPAGSRSEVAALTSRRQAGLGERTPSRPRVPDAIYAKGREAEIRASSARSRPWLPPPPPRAAARKSNRLAPQPARLKPPAPPPHGLTPITRPLSGDRLKSSPTAAASRVSNHHWWPSGSRPRGRSLPLRAPQSRPRRHHRENRANILNEQVDPYPTSRPSAVRRCRRHRRSQHDDTCDEHADRRRLSSGSRTAIAPTASRAPGKPTPRAPTAALPPRNEPPAHRTPRTRTQPARPGGTNLAYPGKAQRSDGPDRWTSSRAGAARWRRLSPTPPADHWDTPTAWRRPHAHRACRLQRAD